MTEAKIFLVNQTKTDLTPMVETTYASEDDLQAYLARYPDLLPGDQIDPENPRRWLLVAREMGIPGETAGSDRWSLDHLFLDQDAIPTFVECKRSSDTRSRREVVAQMLDYAANGIKYWPADRLRQAATESAGAGEAALDEKIQYLLGPDSEENEAAIASYWEKVEQNLREGRIRLIFVADETPQELRRLVEFLNEKMADVEVLAVEIKQFLGQGEQTVLVPRVIGLTEAAREAKRPKKSTSRRPTNRQEFLAKCAPKIKKFFEYVLDAAQQRRHTIYWGTVGFSVRAYLPKAGQLASFVYGYPYDDNPNLGDFTFYFNHLPLTDEDAQNLRKALLAFGIFRESGQKTLKSNVEEKEDLTQFYKAYDFILEKMDEIMKKY